MGIAQNLKLLRKRLSKSQEEVANDLGLTRSSYSGYENSVAQPNLESLILFSDYYKVSIDDLVRKDYAQLNETEWEKVDKGVHADIKGQKLRVLTSVVDSSEDELIEMIPLKASAGYAAGYADPDYIKVLPTFHLPFLSKDRKYRSFPIKGDSMPPVVEGSFVVAEFIQNWMSIRSGTPCIVITKDDGIVFKVVHNLLKSEQALQLCSTNTFYEPYTVHANDILEVWKFVNYISPELPEVRLDDNDLSKSLQTLQKEVHDLKTMLKN
ncbi:MAG: helix-turn-helix transcriptional regulator [Crocinitomicaceae bacterium]|nr:helix-turn-helix transcriptional regulator [Crocinitomicaceae bacterium]MDG1658421.1 helix-turn-helix transcriptional regulator [Crocinitomicaceae bacterium]MDG2440936.1 helix-turn-helix transcriptional regulator [Crocinitomicaceae bacterium]